MSFSSLTLYYYILTDMFIGFSHYVKYSSESFHLFVRWIFSTYILYSYIFVSVLFSFLIAWNSYMNHNLYSITYLRKFYSSLIFITTFWLMWPFTFPIVKILRWIIIFITLIDWASFLNIQNLVIKNQRWKN